MNSFVADETIPINKHEAVDMETDTAGNKTSVGNCISTVNEPNPESREVNVDRNLIGRTGEPALNDVNGKPTPENTFSIKVVIHCPTARETTFEEIEKTKGAIHDELTPCAIAAAIDDGNGKSEHSMLITIRAAADNETLVLVTAPHNRHAVDDATPITGGEKESIGRMSAEGEPIPNSHEVDENPATDEGADAKKVKNKVDRIPIPEDPIPSETGIHHHAAEEDSSDKSECAKHDDMKHHTIAIAIDDIENGKPAVESATKILFNVIENVDSTAPINKHMLKFIDTLADTNTDKKAENKGSEKTIVEGPEPVS